MQKRKRIQITGRVQGVGCRPFIYRAASLLGLSGTVRNDVRGVTIEVQGEAADVERFGACLQHGQGELRPPPLMAIASCQVSDVEAVEGEAGFAIEASDARGQASSQVTPDMATCRECLAELNNPDDFRYRYPFINCTNCGPRYSIVRTIPYDRPNTTMAAFKMCERCAAQYADVRDRRFHAQPVACPTCGPRVWLADAAGCVIEGDGNAAIARTAAMLREGKIVAIKGLGGFHLAVDALQEQAVVRLRQRKRREHKPFAMMAASVEVISRYVRVDAAGEALLKSAEAPVVLLDRKGPAEAGGPAIASSVAEGTATLGFMLCYAPLHHLLFAEEGIEVLVMTSANLSDEPLICDNAEAAARLGDVADAFLNHDRDIYRQVDDSVVQIVDGGPAFLRRSRGYVPTPVLMEDVCPEDVFAAGADLKNTFCFAKGSQLIMSEHIGDLADARVYRHYISSVKHLAGLFEIEPKVVACDLHPGYLSTQYAKAMGKPVVEVQHHWAHVASALAEYGCMERVIGLVADGTGWGTDGAIWGCECLTASLTEFERVGHLAYFPLPGGDSAAKEAIRPAMGLLCMLAGEKSYLEEYEDLIARVEPDAGRVRLIAQQLALGVNTAATSSMGRVFDAAAALAGMGRCNRFEAELPMRFESAADCAVTAAYSTAVETDSDGTSVLDIRKMICELVADVRGAAPAGVISVKFHNGLAEGLAGLAIAAREKCDLCTVALSGGVFCNRYLANRVISMLKTSGFRVLYKHTMPANDGGIALGQAAIAARMLHCGLV
ncbi:MAG: carbamoyltransferase HypF [Phycisphaerae bacterium]|nr:carbamoyltransferase HypF [Phycisphaerae bacterium]